MQARRTASGLCLVTIALAAGCGDGDSTVTEERTVTATETGPATETTATNATEPTTPDTVSGPHYFQTPSGNIGCYLDRRAARCDIAQRDWSPPPAPPSCELDYGQGLTVSDRGAGFVCAGDTTLGAPATLGYGSSAQRGALRCDSEESGVTCTDLTTGRGFFISRQSYRFL